jgi:hypothetical protein
MKVKDNKEMPASISCILFGSINAVKLQSLFGQIESRRSGEKNITTTPEVDARNSLHPYNISLNFCYY